MKKHAVVGIAAAVSLPFLCIPVFLLACAFLLPPQYGETFLGELKEKCALLEETAGKRIVLIGGSGVAFGYDSALLHEAFPEYGVVNFGMYGGLGTKVMLDISEDSIREGDIVILSPEQEAQTLSEYFNARYLWQAADGDFSLLRRIKRENAGQMAGHFPGFALDKLRLFQSGETPGTEGIYRRSSFNEYGDIRSELCLRNVMPGGMDSNTLVYYRAELLEEAFVQDMNEYAGKLQEKGAVVWYRFCPVNALAVADGADGGKIAQYFEILQEKLDFPIIGNPYDSILEAGWFYDTNFHLNAAGKTVNTVQLIRDIKAMRGDDRPVETSLPQMPASAEALAGREVLKKEEYRGNADVRQVRVDVKTAMIEDYAFEGCSSLEAVILENPNPEEILVGSHLLDGTGADIYVPEESLTRYRLNYSWSVYSDRIKPLSTLKN